MTTAPPIRTGIIGANVAYGWGTRAHLPAMQALPEFEVVAVCTTHTESAEETAQRFAIPVTLDDHRTLVNHPDVELVLVCVRVPGHRELATAALEAGKHVYCEWPLGTNLEEATALSELAESRGVRHVVGLQARGAPELNRMKTLIAEGYVGDVLAATLLSSLPGAGERPSRSAWATDPAQGATTLTIAGGHSLDALCFCLGEFKEVSALVTTQLPQVRLTDTGETVGTRASDNVLLSGVLESGAVVSAHIKSVPAHGSGFALEVHGTEGTLVVTSAGSAQIGELSLRGARRGEGELHALPAAGEDRWVPDEVPPGPPLNVAQMFRRLGERIRDGNAGDPDFALAVTRHRLLDAIQRASDTGQRQSL